MRRLHGPQAALHGLGDLPLLGRLLSYGCHSDCWLAARLPGCRSRSDRFGSSQRASASARGPRLVGLWPRRAVGWWGSSSNPNPRDMGQGCAGPRGGVAYWLLGVLGEPSLAASGCKTLAKQNPTARAIHFARDLGVINSIHAHRSIWLLTFASLRGPQAPSMQLLLMVSCAQCLRLPLAPAHRCSRRVV